MFAQLVPLHGGAPITIEKDVTIVGRQPEHCDIVLERKSVSKIHCILARTDGLLFVRDLSSTNGTKVNGQRIVRGALLPGDLLAFAGEKFRVHLGPGPAAPATPPSEHTELHVPSRGVDDSQVSPQVADEDGEAEPVVEIQDEGDADDLVE